MSEASQHCIASASHDTADQSQQLYTVWNELMGLLRHAPHADDSGPGPKQQAPAK
jgi:hypothetical protein